jgi:hypothetical protein
MGRVRSFPALGAGPPDQSNERRLDLVACSSYRGKHELKDRIMAAMDHFNQDPVVHTWSYKLDQAA